MPIVLKSGSLILLEHSGPVQGLLYFYILRFWERFNRIVNIYRVVPGLLEERSLKNGAHLVPEKVLCYVSLLYRSLCEFRRHRPPSEPYRTDLLCLRARCCGGYLVVVWSEEVEGGRRKPRVDELRVLHSSPSVVMRLE